MKYDFTYYNPTRIHFGKESLSELKGELGLYGDNVLLMYGKGSVKRTGIYDKVNDILSACGKRVTELGGIKPNPSYSQVLEGARLVRENGIDLILAVGGGSVIDCAKAVSVAAYCDGDAWTKYWIDFEEPTGRIVPVGSVLTMAGTGSEMNGGSVITNEEVMLKNGRVFPSSVYPKFSILNPEFTYSVPEYQMVSGIFDTMSHLMEQYFSGDDDNVTDYLLEGLMRSLIVSAEKALENPNDYEARSNIMWAATMGLNTVTGVSKTQDWEVHMIEHQIGAYTDCAHGVGLGVISVPYYKYVYKYGIKKFVRFAHNVFDIEISTVSDDETALKGIAALGDFIKKLGIPDNLRAIGVTEEMLKPIADSCVTGGGYYEMQAEDILKVLEAAF